MSGLLRPDSGQILYEGVSLHEMSEDRRSDVRRSDFGFVFQFAELVPELTLRENIALPLELNRVPRKECRRRTAELIELVGIQDQADRRPARVSGGQAQRAAVARAIAHQPKVLFADEPTGSLDTANGEVVLDALMNLARAHGTAIVLVTHDVAIAGKADVVIAMRDGRDVGEA